MGVLSAVAKNAILDAQIGNSRAAGIPTVLYLCHYAGDPTTTGTELTSAGGYGRTSVPLTDGVWAAASGGSKLTIVDITSPVSNGAWSATATHIVLKDSATLGAGNAWYFGALDSSVTVSAANRVVRYAAGGLAITVPTS